MGSIKDIIRNSSSYYSFLSLRRAIFKWKMSHMTKEDLKRRIEKMYEERVGHKLDWSHLVTYTEKMQWEKLYDDNPDKVTLSDKYLVREWVKEKIGERHLIPLLGVWSNASDIDFDSLPNQFVLKTNCGSGDVIIIRDKNRLSIKEIKIIQKKLNYYLNYDFGLSSCEIHYSKIKPMIVAEQFIDSGEKDLPDYKFLCFNGTPYFCWVDIGRYTDHSRHVYDMEWNFQEWNQYYEVKDIHLPRPQNFSEMKQIASILSQGFSHVRVDLYNINGRIFFGEMTFTNGSGFDVIKPEKYDYMLGELWKLNMDVCN